MVEKIISGGQTGVDRAGLDAAIELGLLYGGKVPKGRLSEEPDGVPMSYELIELDSPKYPVRTRANVMDSDGTLILCSKVQYARSRGTKLTVKIAVQYGKPWWIADPTKEHHVERVVTWLREYPIKTLNIAGPRESKCPGIHDNSVAFLKSLIQSF
jgi:hypothetical protein